jgi:hypothetical protein
MQLQVHFLSSILVFMLLPYHVGYMNLWQDARQMGWKFLWLYIPVRTSCKTTQNATHTITIFHKCSMNELDKSVVVFSIY